MGKRRGVTDRTRAVRAKYRARRSIVARRIEEIRKAHGWSCGELAKRISALRDEPASRLLVWRTENGFREATAADAALYAEVFGVDVTSLYHEAKQ